jgi:hypothetical protein
MEFESSRLSDAGGLQEYCSDPVGTRSRVTQWDVWGALRTWPRSPAWLAPDDASFVSRLTFTTESGFLAVSPVHPQPF